MTSVFKVMVQRTTAMVSASAMAIGLLAPVANALTVRDDVTVPGSETRGANPIWDGVVQIYLLDSRGRITFNCTGSLINARTVLSAAHCFNARPSTAYDATLPGGQAFTPIIAYGPDTFNALFNWIRTGEQVIDARNGLTFGDQVIIHPDADSAFGARLPFPGADVAMITLADPLAHLPTYAMLFSPAPIGSHVELVAYGGHGIGSTGDTGIDGKRQAGENILGMIGSQNDFLRGVFRSQQAGIFSNPTGDQTLYFIDFDNPERTGNECARDPDFNDYVCDDFGLVVQLNGTFLAPSPAIDYFPGDALANEAGTAGGDSGSAIFFDQLGPRPLIGGVLSGGFTFTTPIGSGYGDVSYYNPLFLFHQFISEANPYKYVVANSGNGNWSDPTRWVQTLDPNYFIINAQGQLVNGLPTGPEAGAAGTLPREGVVLDTDINDVFPGTGAGNGSAPQPDNTQVIDLASAAAGSLFTSRPSDDEIALNANGAGLVAISGVGQGEVDLSGVNSTPVERPDLSTFLFGDIGTPGPASGPGSTGFVPNNGVNEAGFINYFDVTLNAAGITTVDVDVEIDRLTLANANARLNIGAGRLFESLIDVQNTAGTLAVDGTLETRDLLNFGMLTGNGRIIADSVWNGGMLNATGNGLDINGDLVLTTASLVNFTGAAINVTGDLSVAGRLAIPDARFGRSGRVINYTGSQVGAFTNLDLPGVLFIDVTYGGGAVNYNVRADSFSRFLSAADTGPNALALAATLDAARSGSYAPLSDLYDRIDPLTGTNLSAAINSLTPEAALVQGRIGSEGMQRMTTQLGQRFAAIAGGRADGVARVQSGPFQVASAQDASIASLFEGPESGAGGAGTSATWGGSGWGTFLTVTSSTGEAASSFVGDNDVEGTSVMAGVDAQAGQDWRVGAFLTYGDGESTFTANIAGNNFESLGGGVYAVRTGEKVVFSGYAGIGNTDITTTRALVTGAATGSTEADQLFAGLTLTRLARFQNGFALAPTVSLDYADYAIDGYAEAGGAGALSIEARDYVTAPLRLGMDAHFYDTRPGASASFRPVIGARFVNDLTGSEEVLNARLQGGGAVTRLTGAERDDQWFEVKGAVEFDPSSAFTLGLFVEQSAERDDLEVTTVGGHLRLRF